MKPFYSRLLLAFFMLLVCFHTHAQTTKAGNYHLYSGSAEGESQYGVSLKLVNAMPISRFGATFKKAPGIEIAAVVNKNDGWCTGRLGIYHVSFAPRLDSFPVYNDAYIDGTRTITEGKGIWSNMSVNALVADESYRFFRIRHFSMHGGFGVIVGFVKYTYDEYYASGGGGITEKSTDVVGGLRNHLCIDYTIKSRIRFSAEFMNMITSNEDWSLKTPHNTIGIGCAFYFTELDE